MTIWSGWILHAEPNAMLANGCLVCIQKGEEKVTNYGGLLISNARKANVLLAALLEAKMLRKKRKKMAGGEEQKIW